MSSSLALSMPQDSVNFQETLTELVQGAKLPAKRRGVSLKPIVEDLTSVCYDRGVSPDALARLIDLTTTPSHLDQASLNSIVKNLYPHSPVSSEVVIKIVGCLGHGALKPSFAIQAALLRWLVMVHHAIEKNDALLKSYSVFFNLLDTAVIRPQLCHLLALITRRRHVRPYRIQALLALSRQTGHDPALTGLLRVFKDYYPEIIVGDATRGKASVFKHPDPQWRERLDEIHQQHAHSLGQSNQQRGTFRIARQNGMGKIAKVLPEVHTSHAQEDSVTIEEVEHIDGLVRHLETIEMPSQLVAVLADPLLQKLMLLKPSLESHRRVSNWLAAYTQDVVSGESDDSDLEPFFEVLYGFVSRTKSLPPVVTDFFAAYLQVWDGRSCKAIVLDILTFTMPHEGPFSGIYDSIFAPLEAKVLDGTLESRLNMLKTYSQLLENWAALLLSTDTNLSFAGQNVSELIDHVNKLCLTLVQEPADVRSHSAVLDFYEEVANVASNPRLNRHIRIISPPSPLVYILHFSILPTTVSRLCGILARYKEGFQTAMAKSRSDYTVEYINEFNGFLMDICNCLWRSRSFNRRDANAHACLMPETIVQDLTSYVGSLATGSSIGSLFTMSTSPALGNIATSFLRELEETEIEQGSGGLETRHAGPASKSSLVTLSRNGGLDISWDEFRQGTLAHLEDLGMGGVGQLMHNTMTTLMKKT